MFIVFEGLTLACCIGLVAAYLSTAAATLMIVMKAAASLCFLIAGIIGFAKRRDTVSKKMLTAFALSAVGDILLALDNGGGIIFVIGVASFAAAHVMFLLVFCGMCRVNRFDIISTAVVFGGLLALLLFGDFSYHGMLPVLIAYTVIVSFMMMKALSMWRCREGKEKPVYLIMAGGVCFLGSDVLLLFCLFGTDPAVWIQPANWIVYYIAQICLTWSVNREEL